MLKTRSLIMEQFKKLFITLAVCLGLSALFTSCRAFFDIEFNSPAKLVISDEICEADVYIDIEVYEYNVSSNRRGNCVLSKKCVYLDRGSSKVYNIYNKLDFYSCYEVVINTSCSRSGVQYTEGSASNKDIKIRVSGGYKIPHLNVHGLINNDRDAAKEAIKEYILDLQDYVDNIKDNYPKLLESKSNNVYRYDEKTDDFVEVKDLAVGDTNVFRVSE